MRNLALLAALLTAQVPAATAQVLRVADLSAPAVQGLDRAATVVFLTGGILEEHGPFLPAYTDGILSQRLAAELADTVVARLPAWSALLFPQIPLGASGSNELGGHFVFPGTFAVRPGTLRAVFMDLADELGAQGFRWIVVVHVHGAPLHNRALDDAADYFRDTYGGRMVHLWGLIPVLQGWGRVLAQLPERERQEDGVSLHAGMDETSLLLYLRPDLVAPGYRQAPVVTGHTLEESFDAARAPAWPGYLGSPRLGTAELGKRIWESFRTAAVEQLLSFLAHTDTVAVRRYADLLSGIPLYRGWMTAAVAEEERRAARQRDWLDRRSIGSALILPPPTGAYPVGTSAFLVDPPGASAGSGVDPKPLVVTAWYPAADTTGRRRARYLREEAALQAMASLGRNPATAALLQRGVVTHAWLDAPVARNGSGLPALVFSPGYLAMPSDYTALMEDLASHGFAVFSIAHTGESMAVSLPGGQTEMIFGSDNHLAPLPLSVVSEWDTEDSVSAAVTTAGDAAGAEVALRGYLARIPRSTAAVERWVTHTRLVVNEIARLAAPNSGSRFAGRLNLSRLGALGHSMGGVASAAFCARDRRCRAAINLDGTPQYGDLIDRPSRRPFLMVYGERGERVGVSDLIYARGPVYWRAVLRGAGHLNFGDWQYWEGPSRMTNALGTIPSARATEAVTQLVREFFQAQFGRAESALLSGRTSFAELDLRQVR